MFLSNSEAPESSCGNQQFSVKSWFDSVLSTGGGNQLSCVTAESQPSLPTQNLQGVGGGKTWES